MFININYFKNCLNNLNMFIFPDQYITIRHRTGELNYLSLF